MPTPSNAVITFGDSHSIVMRPAIEAAVVSLGGSTGQIFSLSAITWTLESQPEVYNSMRAELTEHLGTGHVVMFIERGDLTDDFHHSLSIDAFRTRLSFLRDLTSQKGAKLVVLKDSQLLPELPAACKLKESSCETSKADELERQSAKRSVIDEIMVGTSNVFVFDVLEHTCNDTTCSMYEPGGSHILFDDDDHINSCATTLLTAPLTTFLEPLVSR